MTQAIRVLLKLHQKQEGMKMRKIKKNGSTKKEGNIDGDLKWVEENIPSTLGDTVFEKLMDSDEEVEHRKYEMSKMQ
ncbi:transmembrane protein 87A-like [Bolinopsis microptera]|uniref:transmembrane protein 87A-like n=1 Tax=Bolinopsis microptera TaxID=2820187 RepID=UPI00307990F5